MKAIIKAGVEKLLAQVDSEIDSLEERLDKASESDSDAAQDRCAEYEETLERLETLKEALEEFLQ